VKVLALEKERQQMEVEGQSMAEQLSHSTNSQKHYYTNFTGGGRFRFSAAGKAVRHGLEATVNRGLTAAGGVMCPPR